jgi:hypothetical protein
MELLRYDPDVVELSYFGNDLIDNVRSNLFALEGDELRRKSSAYVPAGALGDFLNTNAVVSFLSSNSNAFALLKETVTGQLKKQLVAANLEQLAKAEAAEAAPGGDDYAIRITAAILERIYAETSGRNIPFVIQSIPTRLFDPLRLVDQFPLAAFPVDRPGIRFLPAKEFLEPWLFRELLYYERSQNHWTPLSHELSGKRLAALILEANFLQKSPREHLARRPSPPG